MRKSKVKRDKDVSLFQWIIYEIFDEYGSNDFIKAFNKGKDNVYTKLWWEVFIRNGAIRNPNFNPEEFNTLLEYLRFDMELSKEDLDKKKFNGAKDFYGTGIPIDEWDNFIKELRGKCKFVAGFPLAYFDKAIPVIDSIYGPKKDYERKEDSV